MPSTLILGYGGYGSGCVREYSSVRSWPAAILDTHIPELTDNDAYLESLELSGDESLDESRLRNLLGDYQNILLVSSLGGDSFDYAYSTLSNCAGSLGIPIIFLCTIPFSFETERRFRAMEKIKSLPDSMHNMFIVDLQKTIRKDGPIEDILSYTRQFIINSIGILVNLMECGPFNSYCTSPAYTFAIGSASDYSKSIDEAWENVLFESIFQNNKILACIGSEIESSELPEVQSKLSQCSGIMPEFIHSDALDEHEVVLFIPISCRQHE